MSSFVLWFVISFVVTTVASRTTAWEFRRRRRGHFTPDLTRPPLESTFDTRIPPRS